MNCFKIIESGYSSSSSNDSPKTSIYTKKLLRINTFDDLRENTPSPPYPPKRSPIRTINRYYSPKPESVIKLIETPKNGINNLSQKREKLEKTIENVVENMMKKICIENEINNEKEFDDLKNIEKLQNDLYINIDEEDDLELINIYKNLKRVPSLLKKNNNSFFNSPKLCNNELNDIQ